MKAIIFNGKKFALEKEKELKTKIKKLKTAPRLVSILVGDDPASILYTNLKKKAGERVDINFEIMKFPTTISALYLNKVIKNLNNDETVNGIMIQLPLPSILKEKQETILNYIDPKKDVDGLTKNSPFMPAATKAIIKILGIAKKKVNSGNEKVVVIGSKGMVGKSVVKELKNLKYNVEGVDQEIKDLKSVTTKADILISATGIPNLIKGNMVKDGVVVIDIGSPKGDVLFNEVVKKVSFITPVPGGAGPVTIMSLLENLVQSVYN